MLFGIPHAEALNQGTLCIAQEGEGEDELLDHGRVVRDGVDTDPHDLRSAALKLLTVPGIADQLPIAVWSPVTTVEDQHSRSAAQPLPQDPGIPLLVRKLKVRDVISGAQA
jgi:hypothetical protein